MVANYSISKVNNELQLSLNGEVIAKGVDEIRWTMAKRLAKTLNIMFNDNMINDNGNWKIIKEFRIVVMS